MGSAARVAHRKHLSVVKISVVVPFYNEEAYLDECIAALLDQDYPRELYQVIMVDNNSTDDSAAIAARHPEVTLLSEPTQGDYAARNRGVSAADGEVIAFTDSDTAPRPDWLRAIAAAMSDRDTMLLTGTLDFASDKRDLTLAASYESEKTAFVYSRRVKETYFGYTCNMAVRASAFERLGVFPNIARNSEIVFLRRVIDTFSVDAVQYVPDMRVRRLEIARLGDYFDKLHTYGRDYNRYGAVADLRPLNTRERLVIFRRTVRRYDLSLLSSARLLSLLVAGGVAYETGRARGASR